MILKIGFRLVLITFYDRFFLQSTAHGTFDFADGWSGHGGGEAEGQWITMFELKQSTKDISAQGCPRLFFAKAPGAQDTHKILSR